MTLRLVDRIKIDRYDIDKQYVNKVVQIYWHWDLYYDLMISYYQLVVDEIRQFELVANFEVVIIVELNRLRSQLDLHFMLKFQ